MRPSRPACVVYVRRTENEKDAAVARSLKPYKLLSLPLLTRFVSPSLINRLSGTTVHELLISRRLSSRRNTRLTSDPLPGATLFQGTERLNTK